MAQPQKARVFMSGRSQAVRIPAQYRFKTDEVFIRRDPQTGDVILSQSPMTWEELFAALDAANIPEDFMADRDQGAPQVREGTFFTKVQVLPWGREEAVVYGQLRTSQEGTGKSLGNLDYLIGAHAIATGATLVTGDKAFSQVADLTTMNWATDLQ